MRGLIRRGTAAIGSKATTNIRSCRKPAKMRRSRLGEVSSVILAHVESVRRFLSALAVLTKALDGFLSEVAMRRELDFRLHAQHAQERFGQ